MTSSKKYYNSIAIDYQKQANARLNYLDAVDNYILEFLHNSNVEGYMDVGTGDGRRALKLIKTLKVKGPIVLVDDSKEMLNGINPAENLILFNENVMKYNSTARFDLITCLWNVLGHFPTSKTRKDFFKLVEHYLKPGGLFIYDVNNRYNIAHYGNNNVAKNLKQDIIQNKDSGLFNLGEGQIKTQVYIHSPFDIDNYIKSTGLELEDIIYIDYATGEEKDTFFEGQLIYKLRKPF